MNAGIKYFDFQLLHTSLRINLHLFRISDSELCGKYNKIETITHLLYDCDQPKESMGKNHMWIHKYKKEKFKLNETSILLGDSSFSTITNYMIITTKNEIFKGNWLRKPLLLDYIIKTFKKCLSLENYILLISHGTRTTLGKMVPYTC